MGRAAGTQFRCAACRSSAPHSCGSPTTPRLPAPAQGEPRPPAHRWAGEASAPAARNTGWEALFTPKQDTQWKTKRDLRIFAGTLVFPAERSRVPCAGRAPTAGRDGDGYGCLDGAGGTLGQHTLAWHCQPPPSVPLGLGVRGGLGPHARPGPLAPQLVPIPLRLLPAQPGQAAAPGCAGAEPLVSLRPAVMPGSALLALGAGRAAPGHVHACACVHV